MERRLFVCVLFVSTLNAAMTAANAASPNIVIVVSDDHGFGDIGWNNPAVRTPHLDQLAKDGVRLDRFYANPICSVTRAALMTGLATLRTGVNNSSGLDLIYRILPQAFHDAGYQTWMFGKWHLGGPEDYQRSGSEYFPQARGFDYFYGHLHGAIDYYTHQRKDLGQLDWRRNGKPVIEEGFSTDLLVDDAIRMVKQRHRSQPFFLYLPFNAVHGPLQPPPSATDVSKRDRRELLLANVAHMDAAIGRLLRAIDHEHLREDTLVLFFSDNGGQLSQGASNGGLRGEKGGTFEGGIRVPAAMRWTGVLPAGTISQQFVSVMDVLPTLCEAANIPTGISTPLDGISLWPSLTAGKKTEHPPFVMGNKDVACIAAPWKLVVPGRGETPLLFNIVDDPTEQRDVAGDHPDLVASLLKVVSATGEVKGGGGQRRADLQSDQERRQDGYVPRRRTRPVGGPLRPRRRLSLPSAAGSFAGSDRRRKADRLCAGRLPDLRLSGRAGAGLRPDDRRPVRSAVGGSIGKHRRQLDRDRDGVLHPGAGLYGLWL